MIAVAIAAVFGLAFGSFVSAAIDRLSIGRSLYGRSACDACGRPLGAFELVPVVSYLALGGRCATCCAPIGIRSSVMEAGCGTAFAGAFMVTTPFAAAMLCALLVGSLIACGVALKRFGSRA
jgi:prepilin signal peptidase PulO-like enzyme (type II secretory pathway)